MVATGSGNLENLKQSGNLKKSGKTWNSQRICMKFWKLKLILYIIQTF